jgi:hypothetical protein
VLLKCTIVEAKAIKVQTAREREGTLNKKSIVQIAWLALCSKQKKGLRSVEA